MSRIRSVAGRLTATVLFAAVIGCAGAQSAVLQGGQAATFDAAREIPRMEDLPSNEWATYGYTPAEAGDAQPGVEVPRMEDLPPNEWATYGYTPPADAESR